MKSSENALTAIGCIGLMALVGVATYATMELSRNVFDLDLGTSAVLSFVFGLGVPAALLFVPLSISESKDRHNKELGDFYTACWDRGVRNPAQQWDKEIIELIGKEYGYNASGALQAFKKGQKLREKQKAKAEKKQKAADEEAQRKAKLEKSRAETSELSKETDIASHTGKDKYIAALKQQLDEARSSLIGIRDYAESIKNNYVQSELHGPSKTDWAIAGGAASAIAGPGAGAAVAVNAQAENARRQAEWDKNWQHRVKGSVAIQRAAWAREAELESQIEQLHKRIDPIEPKLVDDRDPQSLFANIDIQFGKPQITEAGNVRVSITTQIKEECAIAGIPAILDGSLNVFLINENGTKIASGIYNAPGYNCTNLSKVGFQKTDSKVVMLVSPAKFEETNCGWTVKAEPRSLWLIEK